MAPIIVIYFVWFVWMVSWFAAALWSNPTIKRAGAAREWFYRVVAVAGAYLMFGFHPFRFDNIYRLWDPLRGPIGWTMVGLVVVGFSFAWWARIHLGRMWSPNVTRKSEHHIIDTGPYSAVRHPIYTGITLASIATAAVQGAPSAFLGAALMTWGWYIKARLEERFLREELGPETYDSYARRVAMLVPYVHWPL